MNEKSSNGMGEEPIRDFEQIKENAEQTNIKETSEMPLEANAETLGSTEPIAEQAPVSEEQAPVREAAEAEPFVYRWDYEAQVAHDRKKQKTQKKKSAIVFSVVMAVAFLLCLTFLGVVIFFNAKSDDQALTTAEVAEMVNPSTVLIYASGNGYGTGFFVRSDGYIVTNCHVVSGASEIIVTLYDGQELSATLKWSSVPDDLAILKIEGRNYPAVRIGNSDALRVGDTAIAIGNPAGNVCPWTTTQGIISSTAREISVESNTAIVDMTLLQTDAQVNPGNSGGPLCNDRGEVIGIVVRKMTSYEGLGMAIPINGAMELVNAYLETGSTEHIRSAVSHVRPTIGIQAAAVKKGDPITTAYNAPVDGILVLSLTENGPAIGVLEPGDIIMEMNGTKTTDMDELKVLLYEYRAGDSVELKVNRMGEEIKLTLKLGVASK